MKNSTGSYLPHFGIILIVYCSFFRLATCYLKSHNTFVYGTMALIISKTDLREVCLVFFNILLFLSINFLLLCFT